MTSIHVNQGTMMALSTLTQINQDLLDTQDAISSGKHVASSADDAAVWAITTVMEADVDGFKAISESLSLGKATLTVARNAAEKVTDLLREVKQKIVTAQGKNVDRGKIETDIEELRKQVASVVSAAQFNGLNLIDGSSEEPFEILASLDRSQEGVKTAEITIQRQDLSYERTTDATFGPGPALINPMKVPDGVKSNANDNTLGYAIAGTAGVGTFEFEVAGKTVSVQIDFDEYGTPALAALKLAERFNTLGVEGVTASTDGATFVVTNSNSFTPADIAVKVAGGDWQIGGDASQRGTVPPSSYRIDFTGREVVAGDSYRVTFERGGETTHFDYVAKEGDTVVDVAEGIRDAVMEDDTYEDVTFHVSSGINPLLGGATLQFDFTGDDIAVTSESGTGGTPGTGAGGLRELADLSVMETEDAKEALNAIERLIQIGIGAASAFGASEKRIRIQENFVGSLVDSMKLGISAMADTDMEKASAMLQTLQVRQQLATQSLSIANKTPQNLLTLFRQ